MKGKLVKVVLDTNIWLSGLFWEGEAAKIIELAERKKIIPLVSKDILQEIVEVLNKESKFQKFLKERKQKIEAVIRKIISISEIIETSTKLDILEEDPSDNKFLETALDENAQYIISYDKHLLDLKEFRNIPILKPNEFLEIKEWAN